MAKNYPNATEEQILDKYNQIAKSPRIGYLLTEIGERNAKLDYFVREENKKEHEQKLKEIRDAYEVKDLPKVGLSELNRKLSSAINSNDFIKNMKTVDFKELTKAYLEGLSFHEKEQIVGNICSNFYLSRDQKDLMKEQIVASLIDDETIEYTVEEILLKEKRRLKIYEENHYETMNNIKEAHRISQLPPNLTVSTLTSYLAGNTTIYSNDNRIKAEDLKGLTQLLFGHKDWSDEEVKAELKEITSKKYPEKSDAFDLLYKKLSSLPRTQYLVEEIEYSAERQKEFIGNACSNVNVYFIPNEKSPVEGGKFYNCYINRIDNLDLEELLPLDLDEIVPPQMDIDSIEWYVQEKFDPTFKAAGGIILNRDETIGQVNIFKPNDGKVGVDPEDKRKIEENNSLELEIEEKRQILSSLDEEIASKEKRSNDMSIELNSILLDYENQMLKLQKDTEKRIETLKEQFGNSNDEKGRAR